MTSHTKKWKVAQLEELKSLISKYPVIAVADINMFPSSLFQQIRKKLSKDSVVKVSKARVIKKAFEESGENVKKLSEYVKGSCAVIFTKMNPFELFAFLKKNKGKVAAKAGAIAEEDIVVPAGDTGLPPGPALSDLKAAGLKVAVQGATIAVLADKVVTKAGEPVSEAVANTLSKLNILPFKVGLNVVAVLEGDTVFTPSVLDIDVDQVFNEFVVAHSKAFNLAVNACVFNSLTIPVLVSKAFSESKSVAKAANFLTSVTVGELLSKAKSEALVVKSLVKEESSNQDASSEAQGNSEQGNSEGNSGSQVSEVVENKESAGSDSKEGDS